MIDLEEGVAILLGATQLAHLEQDDRPGEHRKEHEDHEDQLDQPTRLEDQVEESDAHEAHPPAASA